MEILPIWSNPGVWRRCWEWHSLAKHPHRTQQLVFFKWYYRDYGWIAFGHDWVDYTYTKWVKNNPEHFGVAVGSWEPETVASSRPSGTIAMVSGFPTLVMEGEVYTCSSPTASDCFPDRSDMRERHPRSAVGLTVDKQELIMVAVDAGVRATAECMGQNWLI